MWVEKEEEEGVGREGGGKVWVEKEEGRCG